MKIPVYEQQQTGIQLGPVPRASESPRDERVSSLAPGFNTIARGLESLESGQQAQQNALQRSDEQQAMSRAALQVSALHAGITKDLFDRHQKIFSGQYPDGFDGLVPEFAKKVDDLTAEAVAQTTNPKAKAYLQLQMAHIRDGVVLPKTLATEATARDGLTQYNMTGMVANSAQIADATPDVYPVLRESVTQAIRNSGLDFKDQNRLLHLAQTDLTRAALNAQVQSNFRDFLRPPTGPVADRVPGVGEPPLDTIAPALVAGPLVDAGNGTQTAALVPAIPEGQPPTDAAIATKYPAWADATPELRETIRNRARVLAERADALAVGTLADVAKDHMAAAKNGVPAQKPLTVEDFQRVYGPNSAQFKDYQRWQSVAHIGSKLQNLTAAQIAVVVEDLRPIEGVGTAQQQFAAFNALLKEAAAVTDERKKKELDLLERELAGEAVLIGQGRMPPTPLPPERFSGLNPEVQANYLRMRETGATLRDQRTLTGDELAARATAAAPTGDRLTAVAEARNQQTLWTALDADQKRRQDDPAAYVMAGMPELAGMAAAAFGQNGTPQQMEAFLLARRSQQERLLGTANLLTKGELASVAAQVTAPIMGEGSADNMVARMTRLQQQFGKFFPEVVLELQAAKTPLPASFIGVIGQDNPAIQARDAALGPIKMADLEKEVPGITVSTAKAAVLREFAPMFESIGVTPGNQTPIAGLLETALKGTLAEMRANGNQSVDDAAKRNAAYYTSMYQYFPNAGAGSTNRQFMVPKNEQPELVARGAAQVVNTLPLLKLPVPPDLSGLYKGDEAAREWAADVAARPVWMVNNSGTGLVLSTVDRYGNLRPVMTERGRFGYDWDAFRAMAESGRGTLIERVPRGTRRPYVPSGE